MKRMTKEEALEFLKNKKTMVLDADQSLSVQKKLFEIGFVWADDEVGKVRHLDEPFLFIGKDKELTYIDKTRYEYFCNHPYEFISPYEILELEIQEEKEEPQFKVGEWVLVRYGWDDRWELALFAYHSCDEEGEEFHTFGGGSFYECLPYKGNEKLLGTTNMP